MNSSLSDIAIAVARDMLMFWAAGSALRLVPNVNSVCDKIELGKKVLTFIGEAPEWANYDKNLEDNVDSLKREMETLRCVKGDVCREVRKLEFENNAKRKREVEVWIRNVRMRNQEVRHVESEMGQTGAFSRFLFRAWLGSCVEKKKKEVSLLLDQKRAFEQQLVVNAYRVGRERLLSSELVGQVADQRKEEIWGHLTSQEEVTILGVEGEGGMGKSTTMMHIYNRILDNPRLFDCAFYVTIKEEEESGVYQLQTAIGKEMKLVDLADEDEEKRRAARIHRALLVAKRFVLILDGLTSHFELNNVGIPIERGGGKLVVVSRSKRVCQRMMCKPIVRFDALPFEDARMLFMETMKVSSDDDLSPEITFIADKIVQGCSGVPRRIVEAAESLRNDDNISSWNTKLSEL